MNVLILGGTGAMGVHLVDVLSSMGVNCMVTSRKKHPDKEGVEYVVGNAKDDSFLEPLLVSKPWDAIVDFMVYKTQAFKERVDRLLKSTGQYVFLSSSRVYAENRELITEDSPRLLDVCTDKEHLQTDEYALAKARQEDILYGSGRRNWTIIRPYITFSEIRLQLSPLEKECWLYRALHGKTIVFSRDLAERYTTLTYGLDVAKGIASLLGHSSALGECFHITANESHQWKEILELYLDVIERKTGHRPKTHLAENWSTCMGGIKTR